MLDAAIKARILRAASPATAADARAAAVLSELTDLAMELARAFQAKALAAVQADDLDRAGQAEAGFNRTALGIRRAIALDAKLRRQREEARHKAEARRDRLQDRKDDRRRAVAEGISRAIAVVRPEVQERLTADLWERLTESDRIDADLADTALPIEALIRRLGRQIGLADSALVYGLDPNAEAGPPPALPEPLGTMDDLLDADGEPTKPIWPPDGPARYWRYKYNKDGSTDGCPFWYDTVTQTRLDRPPWKLPPDHPAARPPPPPGDTGRPPGYEAAFEPPVALPAAPPGPSDGGSPESAPETDPAERGAGSASAPTPGAARS